METGEKPKTKTVVCLNAFRSHFVESPHIPVGEILVQLPRLISGHSRSLWQILCPGQEYQIDGCNVVSKTCIHYMNQGISYFIFNEANFYLAETHLGVNPCDLSIRGTISRWNIQPVKEG